MNHDICLEILELRVGKVRPLGPKGVPSAISKDCVDEPVFLSWEGFVTDEQGNRKHHGGIEKAVHHYPREHYDTWLAEDPTLANSMTHGAGFGENISTLGLLEAHVCIGDVFDLGEAQIQISQGRLPCWRLNLRHDTRDLAKRVQQTRRTGWYYRVLREGLVQAGDNLTLVSRSHPDWPLSRVQEILFGSNALQTEELTAMASIPELSPRWKELASKRLKSGQIEDATARLETPEP